MMRLFLVFFLALVFLPAGVLAQANNQAGSKEATAAPRLAWQVNCGNNPQGEFQCVMNQSVLVAKTGQRVISAQIVKDVSTQQVRLILNLPHGISLPDGVDIWVDDEDRSNVTIARADQNGSYATKILKSEEIDQLKNGAIFRVAVKSAADTKQPIVFQLSLLGFTAAFGKL